MKILSGLFQKWLMILLLLPALLLCASCGKKDKTEESSPTAPAPEGQGQTFTLKDDKGKQTTVQVGGNEEHAVFKTKGPQGEESSFETGVGTVPKGFPEDFPICANTKVSSQVMTVPDSTVFTLSLDASDSVDKVAAFYEKALPEKGYDVKATMSMEGATHFIVEKGEKIAGNVVISQDDGQVVVAISLQVKK